MVDQDIHSHRHAPPRAGRLLTLRYIFALSSVAALSIGSQWLIQSRLVQGESDSNVINVAGRQRMLSQRLAKSSLRLLVADDQDYTRVQEELSATLQLWSTSQHDLQHGNAATGLPGGNSQEVKQLFAAIQTPFKRMHHAGQSLATLPRDDARLQQLVSIVQDNEAEFLEGMDAIVSQYVLEAESKVARLRRLERTILALTLAVLLGEGLWIFRPAVNRIRQMVLQLDTAARNLQTAKEEAEAANAAKSRFLGNVSHELRTPMTAVLGMTELASQTTDADERRRYLQIVSEAGNNLLALLNDLIDVAQMDRDQLELSPEAFSPRKVCEHLFHMIELQAKAKNLRLVLDDHTTDALVILADRRRIEQILLNLASNALKYTQQGTITLSCSTKPVGEDHLEVTWNVADSGAGIAEADMGRVFEPFTRLPTSTAQAPGGAGLGLSICRRLADALGASLELRSEVGQGTLATLRGVFPLATHSVDAPPAPATYDRASPQQILVVEDTRPNQILIERYLADAGHQVVLVGSGEEALELYAASRFDSVVIDLQLPGINGMETCRRLREFDREQGRKHPRMICLTADVGFAANMNSQAFGSVVTKPFDRAALLTSLFPETTKEQVATVSNCMVENETPIVDPSLQRELVAAYLAIEANQRTQLISALENRRYTEAALLAHRICGQVSYLSDSQLAESLLQLELACENQDDAAAAALAEKILPCLEELGRSLAGDSKPIAGTKGKRFKRKHMVI